VGVGPGPSEQERADALQTFTRGSGPGFLVGADHQRLVEGRSCDHRGLSVGSCVRFERRGSRTWLLLVLGGASRRGDGLLVEGGFGGDGELGGRVWAIEAQGYEIDSVSTPSTVGVWLGPDVAVDGRTVLMGRRVYKTSAPSVEKRISGRTSTSPR